ncbi:hypothetical protein [Merismopedia glauca]|uniref:hypothetical protein n=1 Tax=Merismopedia glauca TaxID=292586 RepID=UPI0015E797F1|nr:hypothetical protein [Merismopedia glauca]
MKFDVKKVTKPYHSPNFIEHGNAEEILESIETTQPAKRCNKPSGSGDGFGFSQIPR